ncbi:MAG: DUF309 domain-containing protein [Deltaproteobacteria bacterium]|nr:DUF309 domain-containing protein [Deltaproteobacteria bacterium]
MAGIDARFAEGVQLFNQGNFFEAHELWEHRWKKAEGEEKTFYQGLIQAAVALCHVQRGNYTGAISVYLKSWPKLARFPAVWMGIELGQFRRELRWYFNTLRTSSNARSGNCQSVRSGQIVSTAQPPIIRWASM